MAERNLTEHPTAELDSSSPSDLAVLRDGVHSSVRYEASDLSLRWLLIVVGLLGVTMAAGAAGTRWYLYRKNARYAAEQPSGRPAASSVNLPAEPQLERLKGEGEVASPLAFREQEAEEMLRSYGHTEDKGFARVPMKRAIKHLVEQQNSEQRTHQRPKSRRLISAGDANSGRLLQKDASR